MARPHRPYEDFGTGMPGHGGYGDSWSDGGGHHGGMDGGPFRGRRRSVV